SPLARGCIRSGGCGGLRGGGGHGQPSPSPPRPRSAGSGPTTTARSAGSGDGQAMRTDAGVPAAQTATPPLYFRLFGSSGPRLEPFSGGSPEDVVPEVPIQQEPEPVGGPEAAADDRQRVGPEVGPDRDPVVGLEVDVGLGALGDGAEVEAD